MSVRRVSSLEFAMVSERSGNGLVHGYFMKKHGLEEIIW